MPSSWNVYYVIFLSAVLALGIPAALGLVSHLVSSERARNRLTPEVLDEVPREDHTHLGKRVNARFFLGVNAALILITLMVALIPSAGALRSGESKMAMVRTLVAILTISAFAALGLLYSARKGDLSWLKSYQKDAGDTAE